MKLLLIIVQKQFVWKNTDLQKKETVMTILNS